MRKFQQALTPPMCVRWPLFTLFCLASGLVFALLVRLIDCQDPARTAAALTQGWFWLTALFFGLLTALLGFLAHSLFAGCLIVGLAAVVFSLVNYFKVLITSIPLSLGDFTLIGQMGDIAGLNAQTIKFSVQSVLALVLLILWLLLALFFSEPLRIRWRWSLAAGGGSALLFLLLFWFCADPLVFTPLGAAADLTLSQTAANQACGPALGLWRSAYRAVHRDNLSPEQLEEALGQAEELSVPQEPTPTPPVELDPPNIILILSESFADPTKLKGVSFPEDPVADFHALQKEGVSGTFYTRSLGYGTCNIELEVLTGMNTGLLSGEDLYSWDPAVFSRLPSVVSLLKDAGYRTSMLHMYNDGIYHRTNFFSELGFEKLYFSDSLKEFYPPAMEAEIYWDYMATRIQGRYYSDDLMTDALIALYEQQSEEGDGPLFLYGISMENHSAYTGGKYPEDQITVAPQSDLTGEAEESLLALCQGVSNASAALGKLADYFRNSDEPVVIVFYGDHQAGLGLSEGGTVYSELGMVPADRSQWTTEDIARMYSSDYLIWSNDPAYLPGQAGSTADTSCNYLGATLLDLAQADKPLYWKIISQLARTRLCDTVDYHLSRTGVLTAQPPADGPDARKMALLAGLINDAVYGEGLVTDKIS